MSLLNSHKNKSGQIKRTTESTKSKRSKSRFGWIDLNKNRSRIGVLIILALVVVSILGAFQASLNKEPDAKSASSLLLSWINPFGSSNPAGTGMLQLEKEYIYAQDSLIAVEDAGATSVPPTDLAIWRPSTGQWWTKAGQSSQQVTVQWGIASDIPSIGDYDGDGKTDFCVFRPSEGRWYMIKSSTGDSSWMVSYFGQNGDIPAPADYDGDGMSDFAVWRPNGGIWYITRSSDGGIVQLQLGSSGDVPTPKDFDGDGKADIAVWRSSSSTFYSINSSNSLLKYTNLGMTGEPVPGDFDGDGKSDHAVRNGPLWKIRYSASGNLENITWQGSEDIAVQNDYDGDGRVDIAVWKPSNGKWFIRNSSNGETRVEQWGMNGDVPVPALFRR